MDKEEILKMSREENEGRQDEYEMAATSTVAKAGMMARGLVWRSSGSLRTWPAEPRRRANGRSSGAPTRPGTTTAACRRPSSRKAGEVMESRTRTG